MRHPSYCLKRAGWIAVLLAAACAHKPPAKPMDSGFKEEPIPEDLRAKVERSIELGQELYRYDKVADIGTDVLQAEFKAGWKERFLQEGLAGYIAAREANQDGSSKNAWVVLFYSGGDPALFRYAIHVPIGTKVWLEKLDPPKPAIPDLQGQIDARAAALKAAGPFGQSINPVVIPAGDFGELPGDLLVELLAGTTETNAVVLGKHFRVITSPEGVVRSVTPLSKTAQVMRSDPKVGKPVSIVTNEVVADYPLEIHVFASLQAKMPIYVINARGFWLVDGDKVSYLGHTDAKK
jgi:hypothetical protein